METRVPGFASRTNWNLEPNRLAELLELKRRSGAPVLDLTESNPTRCGLGGNAAALEAAPEYDPQPRGLAEARCAVADYYDAAWRVSLRPEQILLTTGSSEAYGFLFRLLAEPGDNALTPHPGYPLFEFLSRLNDLELGAYALDPHQQWAVDFGSIETAVNARTRAVVVVNPNNPTGSLLKRQERERLLEFCCRHRLALISDEVFLDYAFPWAAGEASSVAGESAALTFALSGLSKIAALPQMKLGWIVVGGPGPLAEQALARLEVICDTYLSVATPVQRALPRLLEGRGPVQRKILERAEANLKALDERLAAQELVSRLSVEAGWSVVLRVPRFETDEAWAVELLEKDDVLVHPGHFFDVAGEGYLVASLLTPPEVFGEGIARLLARLRR